MPFLPMKYPEYRLSMEAALPSSVHSWLRHELEQRGIDSLVYTRYIISLLLQEDEDLESLETECDQFSSRRKPTHCLDKVKARRSVSEEERKKLAAVHCLAAATDEESEIEALVEELSFRLKDTELLKDTEIQASVSPVVELPTLRLWSDDSSTENLNPAQRYYAAFPALHGQQAPKNPSPPETIWRNNPLVNKSLASLTCENDSSSANEDSEIRNINVPNNIIVPRQRKPTENTTYCQRTNPQDPCVQKAHADKGGKPRQTQKEQMEPQKFPLWPPGFAKLDPVILHNVDIRHDDIVRVENGPRRDNDEACSRVECLLKGMLLPAPEKTYKDLIDVDPVLPGELRERVDKKAKKGKKLSESEQVPRPVSSIGCMSASQGIVTDRGDCHSTSMKQPFGSLPANNVHDESISPELQEQEIWYTQPIDVVFHSQDDEVSNSKQRLYKRNSNPTFSPKTTEDRGSSSSSSSSVSDCRRSVCASSDKSDDILVGSVLIPSWLTEVISADEQSETGKDIDLSTSLKSSSPFPSNSLPKSVSPVCLIGEEAREKYGSAWDEDDGDLEKLDEFDGVFIAPRLRQDVCSTPLSERCLSFGSEAVRRSDSPRSDSVSLLDLDYMSKFLISDVSEWESEDVLSLSNTEDDGKQTAWQNRVLFDSTLDFDDSLPEIFVPNNAEEYESPGWQPIGSSYYSQLWDVNMQKRNKMSLWGSTTSSYLVENSVWMEENTLVVIHAPCPQGPDGCNENTLIPQIFIDLSMDTETEDRFDNSIFDESDIDVDCNQNYQYFDRSVSMGDVPSLWDDYKKTNLQLSQSFELVPSEHSAFIDVPKKLCHVHSEPNLVQFRQEFREGSEEWVIPPQGNLLYSPRTHFRPITPAQGLELITPKSKQQVCHDLFGGLPSTKTPYQQYQSSKEDQAFIPSFKVKNYSKSIQTGESMERSDLTTDSENTSEERDTPETLTLSILEDIINDTEKEERLVSINEETANRDSDYDTDYGGNAGLEAERSRESSESGCMKSSAFETDYNKYDGIDHGHLGDVVDFSVDSFMATFPHKQDRPNAACHIVGHQDKTWFNNIMAGFDNIGVSGLTGTMMTDKDFIEAGWRPYDPNNPAETSAAAPPFPVESAAFWGDEVPVHQIYDEMDKYKNIWSSGGNEYFAMDVGHVESGDAGNPSHLVGSDNSEASNNLDTDSDEAYDNVPGTDIFCTKPQAQEAALYKEEYDNVPSSDSDVHDGSRGYTGFPEYRDLVESRTRSMMEVSNYWSVKLVYKDQQSSEGTGSEAQHSYGSYELMPMPDEAVTSTELEKEWLDGGSDYLGENRKHSSSQRKPCSFYLEGNCRRSDCKFAHDISNITCRFWEEGGCFKGPLCPFLHGYPRDCRPESTESVSLHGSDDRERFGLNNNEFPELSPSSKNTGTSSVTKKTVKVDNLHNLFSICKKENNRNGKRRRHSNKENRRCETKLMTVCSSSI